MEILENIIPVINTIIDYGLCDILVADTNTVVRPIIEWDFQFTVLIEDLRALRRIPEQIWYPTNSGIIVDSTVTSIYYFYRVKNKANIYTEPCGKADAAGILGEINNSDINIRNSWR